MANPFLMTDDDVSAANDMNSNPFLMGEPEAESTDYCSDNPFMVQTSNPFADFGGGGGGDVSAVTTIGTDYYATTAMTTITSQVPFYTNDISGTVTSSTVTAALPIDSAMSFFGTTISEDVDEPVAVAPQKPVGLNIFLTDNLSHLDDNLAYSSDEELMRDGDKQRNIPPRPVPPSQTTQDLILSVADQLDQTSSHLLGRLPRTRTPSPVSMRDFQSPSPTPDVGDLLDVSDMMGTEDMMTHNDDDFPPPPPPVTGDNPFGFDDTKAEPMRAEPQRPPPPRPTPPRPTPPRRPSPPAAIQATPAPPPARPADPVPVPIEADLFDMFGPTEPTPKRPAPPKSNQDIMSLFSAPKPGPVSVQPDLLSNDLLSMDNDLSSSSIPVMGAPSAQPHVTQMTQMMPSLLHINTDTAIINADSACDTNLSVISSISAVSSASVASSDSAVSSEPPPVCDVNGAAAAAMLTPTSDHSAVPENMCQSAVQEKENILDDVDSTPQVIELITEPMYQPEPMMEDTLNFAPAAPMATEPTVPVDIIDYAPQYEHMDTTMSMASTVNPFATPEEPIDTAPVIVKPAAPIVPRKPPVPAPPIRHVVEAPPPRPPSLVTSAPITIDGGFKKSDEFDAFAAKFDLVKKDDHSLLDGFGGKSPTPSTVCGKW